MCALCSVMPTWVMCLMMDQTQQVSDSVSTVWPSSLNPGKTTNLKILRKTDELY